MSKEFIVATRAAFVSNYSVTRTCTVDNAGFYPYKFGGKNYDTFTSMTISTNHYTSSYYYGYIYGGSSGCKADLDGYGAYTIYVTTYSESMYGYDKPVIITAAEGTVEYIKELDNQNESFVNIPTVTLSGVYTPTGADCLHDLGSLNDTYTFYNLDGTAITSSTYVNNLARANGFFAMDFAFDGVDYKALYMQPKKGGDTGTTVLALFKDYPELELTSDNYCPMFTFNYTGTARSSLIPLDDIADLVLEFATGEEMNQGSWDFKDGVEMPESLARFFTANYEEARTYSYTVDGVQTKATWDLIEPYEKMAVAAENANVILTFTDADGQSVNMIFATGKDPAEYAVTGARLYDGDTGDEIGYCEVGQSIELPADVYNLQIHIEYENLPEGEDITAYFYENAAEKNRVDKTDYLAEAFTQRGYLRSACDVTNPVMVFEYAGPSIPTFNYVYIPRFSRYYYLEKLVIIDTGLYEMYLKVDVLNTYKDTIKAQAGTVARNQYTYNEALTDGQRAVENTPHTSKHTLTISGTSIVQGLGDLNIDTPACYVISVLTSQS